MIFCFVASYSFKKFVTLGAGHDFCVVCVRFLHLGTVAAAVFAVLCTAAAFSIWGDFSCFLWFSGDRDHKIS